ncbi:MAG: enoyl-CoA hydratase/isomerase family protein [Saprospiraceae bacterium]|nr:enoyl-CoA hydratase/isomerase family protein [Saprospiraceae bacterium]
MDKTQQGFVTLSKASGVGTIEFFHPSHNSLPGNLLKQLADTITRAGEDPEIKVVVLRSSGERTFCAGASFDELISIENYQEGKTFFLGFANVINAMRKCPKFIIGRIQGKAVGGGVGLASAVDYCMATKYASVKLSELAVGIGPFVVGPAVERKVGTSAFSQMAINATEWQTAAWAKEKGLFNEVFDEVDQMDAYIEHLSGKLIASNPAAMKGLKEVFWEGCEDWDVLLDKRAGMSGELVLSTFTREAIQSFKAKA